MTKKATKSKPRKTAAKLLTLEEAAAIDFEPWQKYQNLNVSALKVDDPHLISLRMAYALAHKSKPELVAAFENAANETLDFLDDLEASRKFFQARADLINMVSTRLIIAGACCCAEAS